MYLSGDFKRFDSVKAVYDQAYESQPDWQMYVADMYDKAGVSHFEEARERYESSLRIDTHYLSAFEHYLNMLVGLTKYQDAADLFERFPHFVASSPALALYKAAVLVMIGKRDEAMQLFESAIKTRTGDMRAISRFLDALDQRFDADGKDRALTTLATVAGDNVDIVSLLAEQAISKKEYAKGKELAEKGLKADPSLAVLHVLNARAELGLGESDKGLQLVDSLYPANQHDPEYAYQYSRLLAENGINLDKAANLARGSVMYSNYQMRNYMNLIEIYYQMGRYDLSWNESANLSVSFPTRPEAFYYLGRAGVHIGKPDNKKMLERSIALGLGGDALADAKKLLSQMP
jgi:tetratricopeptide (TPR) repeat protein